MAERVEGLVTIVRRVFYSTRANLGICSFLPPSSSIGMYVARFKHSLLSVDVDVCMWMAMSASVRNKVR